MAYERTNQPGFSNIGTNKDSASTIRGFTSPTAEFHAEAEAASKRNEQEQNRGNMRSIFSQNTAGAMSRQTGTARLNDLYERTVKFLRAEDVPNMKLTAFKLDHVAHNVYLPSVLIIGRETSRPEVAYIYTLLIERDEKMDPEIRTQQGGYKTVIPMVAGTAWDEKYVEAVRNAVSASTGLANSGIYVLPACVVPKDLDIGKSTDLDTQTAGLLDLIYNACYAINTRIKDDNGESSGYVLSRTANNEVMTVEPTFSRRLKKDMSGREKRADVDLTFSLKQQSDKSRSVNGSGGNSKVFGTMCGYMDFIMIRPEGQNNTGWGNVNVAVNKFNPLFVITSMFTEQAGSLAAHLVMLMSAATMAAGDEWVNSNYERHQASKKAGEPIDIGEIGVLNMDVNLPQYRAQDAQGANNAFGPILDTRIADYDRNKYIALVQQLCHQDMYIALDAPSVGAESWYMDIFRVSAGNGDVAAAMTAKIFDTLIELTDSRFAVAFQAATKNTALWLSDPIMIHNGYYVNQNGERRDIRDIDTLAIMNVLGPNDPSAGARWAATFSPNADPERALTERKELIEQVCGGSHNVVYTGYSSRLLLNPAVIEAMLMSAQGIGFNMRFVSAYSSGFGNFTNQGFNFGGASGLKSTNVASTYRGGYGNNAMGNVVNSNSFFGGTDGGNGGLKM